MNVVGHQAIGPDLDRGFAATFGQNVAMERIVGRFEEDLLAAIAGLGHVMRKSWSDDAAKAQDVTVIPVLRPSNENRTI